MTVLFCQEYYYFEGDLEFEFITQTSATEEHLENK